MLWYKHMPTIPLSPRGETLVSEEDFERVSQYVWYWNEFGAKKGKRPRAYRRFKVGKTWKLVYLHRFLLNPPAGMCVDHINGDTLDNRRENLRICTYSQNSQNVKVQERPNKSSSFKGIYFDKARQKYVVRVSVAGKTHMIGAFKYEQNAAKAYNRAAKELHGEFHKPNSV